MLTPAADTRAADWIVAALTTFAKSVESLVPAGFEAYVRVFHPATRYGDPVEDLSRWTPVRWREIAGATGRTAHAGMQLPNLTGAWARNAPGLFDREPGEGSLPESEIDPLVSVLARHTQTPDRCWFASWEGWGRGIRGDVAAAPKFQVPHRGYHLLQGEIAAAAESLVTFHLQTASIWWPDDRAWCVATEVDLNTTFVGCSRACAAALVESAGLEAFEVDPTWYFNDDQLNPAPPRRG